MRLLLIFSLLIAGSLISLAEQLQATYSRSAKAPSATPIVGVLPLPETVSVSGGVVRPQRLPWTPGMTVLSVIFAAGGPTEFASDKVDLIRRGKPSRFSLQTLKNEKSVAPELKPFDQVIIR